MRYGVPVAAVVFIARLAVLTVAGVGTLAAEPVAASATATDTVNLIESGRTMYMQGILPSCELMTAAINGNVRVTGEQVVCGNCHRRSGMGSSEGQEVVPSITGDILYNPLRLHASKPPLPPLLRPAYTDATLKRAIVEGVDANGKTLDAFMPRFQLTDPQLDVLLDYLKVLNTDTAPGVDQRDIHFATIISDTLPAGTRKALLDVMRTFFEQKNVETRNESSRAAHAPWHKDAIFKPYRKWVLHIWELQGPRASWGSQLQDYYRQQPVFAVLSGAVPGSWGPVHDFCESTQLPCLFPTTELPVHEETDFYSVYFSRGMELEGQTIVQHLSDDGLLATPVIQVFSEDDPLGKAAAAALGQSLEHRGGHVRNFPLPVTGADAGFRDRVLDESAAAILVLWLGESDLGSFRDDAGVRTGGTQRIYLSTTLAGSKPDWVQQAARERVYFVHRYELPDRQARLIARSTGWFRIKRIYADTEKKVQANAYFALKMAGGALISMHGYFSREYFMEQLEHMVDIAMYTSVYPHISLAPGQRFVSKGSYITRLSDNGSLFAVSDWLIPGSNQ